MATPAALVFDFSESNSSLVAEIRAAIYPAVVKYSKLNQWKSLGGLVFDWAVILGGIVLANRAQNFFVTTAALLIIAGRQHALFILMHESAHYRLFKNRWLNDAIGRWFVSYPCLFKMEAYRANHWEHHRHTNTDRDPDWIRKKDSADWQFPMSRKELSRLFIRYALGYGAREMIVICQVLSGFKDRRDLAWRFLYYTALGSIVIGLGFARELLLFWLFPLFFLNPFLMRIRSIAEHFSLPREHELNSTRNVQCGWIERIWFAPHDINLHADHHLYPSIPFYHLRAFHRELAALPRYRDQIYENTSYLGWARTSLLGDLLHGPR